MKSYKIKKGRHFSFPRRIRFTKNPRRITWTVKFDENCNYVLKNADGSISNDQKDWNKLCGIFFALFNTRKDTAMMGWRYNVEDDIIELAPYYHINKSRDIFPPMLQVKRGEQFEVTLNVDKYRKEYRWFMKKEGFENQHYITYTHSKKWCSYINFYFGGNQKAPKTMTCQIGLKVEK